MVVLPVLFFTPLTVLITWPQAAQMSSAVVGQVGDNIYFIWLIEWFKRALFELHISPTLVPFLNYPEGWNLAYTEITPAMVFLALPAYLLGGGPTLGYNLSILLSFVLSGFGMYLWVTRMLDQEGFDAWAPAAGLIAGTIFAFSPYRMAHYLAGHLNLSGTQWFPLYMLGLFDLLRSRTAPGWAARSRTWQPILLAGICLGLIGLTAQYYMYMTLLVSGLSVIGYFLLVDGKALREWGTWLRLGAMGLVSLPLLWIAEAPFIQLQAQGGLADRSINNLQRYSASPTDFFLPSTDHFLWGSWVGAHFDRSFWIEATLYLGVVAMLLALTALWKSGSLRIYAQAGSLETTQPAHGRSARGWAWLLGLVALITAVLAMGIDLNWLGQPVIIHIPAALQGMLHRSQLPVHLPGYYMYQYLPFFAKMRVPMRFGVFTSLFVSALAGIGCRCLLQWVTTRQSRQDSRRAWAWGTALTAGLLLLVGLDFYPGPYTQFFHVAPRPVDLWLAQQPGSGAVAQFPFSQEADQDQVFYSSIYNKPFIGGFFNAFPPAQYVRIQPVLEKFPDPDSIALLRSLGVQFVVIDTRQYPDLASLETKLLGLGLEFQVTAGTQSVYVIRGTP
jgi:hypothetical protein